MDKALKASWSRRIYKENESWEIFPIHYGLDKISIFGDIYRNNLKNSTKNIFWLDYIIAIEDLIVKRQPFNFMEACAVAIWYNSKICQSKNSAWFKRGIRFIGDLLNALGQIESREEIITEWGISCNFLEYEQMRFGIQNSMKNHIDGTMFI